MNSLLTFCESPWGCAKVMWWALGQSFTDQTGLAGADKQMRLGAQAEVLTGARSRALHSR